MTLSYIRNRGCARTTLLALGGANARFTPIQPLRSGLDGALRARVVDEVAHGYFGHLSLPRPS